jgi:hypothetical protein
MHTMKRFAASAAMAGAAVTAVLTLPGAAGAASRGFVVHNESSRTFVLQDVRSVPCHRDDVHCKTNDPQDRQYPMEFEGLPAQRSKLAPGKADRFELKYGASLLKDYSYAADLWYDDFRVRITTTTTSNDSECSIRGAENDDRITCTAEGLRITIEDKRR